MLKDLLKEGGLYTVANLVTKGVGLLLIPFYADYFTQAEYGIISMLGIAGAVSAAIFSFQIYQGVGRFISPKETSFVEKKRIGSTGFWFTVLSYLVFVALAYLFKNPIIDLLSEDQRIPEKAYLYSILAIALSGAVNALNVQLKFLRKTKAFSLTTFLFAFINILLILYFAFVCGYRVESIYLATICSSPLLLLLQFYFLKEYIVLYLGKSELKKLLQFSIPLIPAALAYLVLNMTDRFFIKEMEQSLAQVGIYEMAFKFSSIVSLVLLSFQSALAPIIFEQHAQKSTKLELGRMLRLFIGIGTISALLLSFFSFETLYLFTNEQYYDAHIVMPLFYLTVIITGLGMFSPGIHLKNKTKIFPIAVGISAVLNFALNFYLVPKLGILGAAIATLISTLFNNLVLFIISQRLYKLPFELNKTVLLLLVFTIFFLAGNYFLESFPSNYSIQLITKCSGILIYTFIVSRMNFINFGEIKALLKK